VILEERFEKIMNFLIIKPNKLKLKKLEDNWRSILGGKKCVISKRKKGTFDNQLKDAQKKE
jgi:uncharacterized membrane protein YgaE (UPF0421/DUF939 family)